MTVTQFRIKWVDAKREPQCPPNPAYPNGIDLDCSAGAALTCAVTLSYPARRCGRYEIECRICGLRVGVTTAGRPDDPKGLKMACRPMARA